MIKEHPVSQTNRSHANLDAGSIPAKDEISWRYDVLLALIHYRHRADFGGAVEAHLARRKAEGLGWDCSKLIVHDVSNDWLDGYRTALGWILDRDPDDHLPWPPPPRPRSPQGCGS
jgi:hypothetical protein